MLFKKKLLEEKKVKNEDTHLSKLVSVQNHIAN